MTRLLLLLAVSITLFGSVVITSVIRDSIVSDEIPTGASNVSDDDEVSVENAPSESTPFFYASAAAKNGNEEKEDTDKLITKDEKPQDDSSETDTDDLSEEELEQMMVEVVDDIMMSEVVNQQPLPRIGKELLPSLEHPFLNSLFPKYERFLSHVPEGQCPPCDCSEEKDEGDSFVFDPTIRYESFPKSRKRRSLDNYWYNVGQPSEHLLKHNVKYRIKNDLLKRLENDEYPLHEGHIYTGDKSKHPHDRTFGYYADFDLYHDAHAFKQKPSGPRLDKGFIKRGFPIYAYSLYKLKGHVGALVLSRYGLEEKLVYLDSGLFKFIGFSYQAQIIMEDLETSLRYVLAPGSIFNPKILKNFQALLPFEDPNGRYVTAKTKFLGDVFMIHATPLNYHNPKTDHHLLHHGYPDFDYLRGPVNGLFGANREAKELSFFDLPSP